MIKICKYCNLVFEAERKERKYCSHKCAAQSYVGISRPISKEHKAKLSTYALNRPKEHREKLGKSHKAEKAWNWKGNEVKYKGLHKWVRDQKQGGDRCEKCGQLCKTDLANISQEYKRDLTDWIYLCRLCHMKSDGRYDKLVKRNIQDNPSKYRRYNDK